MENSLFARLYIMICFFSNITLRMFAGCHASTILLHMELHLLSLTNKTRRTVMKSKMYIAAVAGLLIAISGAAHATGNAADGKTKSAQCATCPGPEGKRGGHEWRPFPLLPVLATLTGQAVITASDIT